MVIKNAAPHLGIRQRCRAAFEFAEYFVFHRSSAVWKSPVPPAGEEGSPEGCVPLALSAEDRGSKGQRPLAPAAEAINLQGRRL